MLEEIDEGVVFGSLPIIRHGQSHTTKDKMEPQVQDSSSRSSRRGSPAQDHHPRGTSAHVTWRGGLSAETSHQEVHVAHRTRVHDVEDLYENIKIDDEETFLPGQGGEGPASHNWCPKFAFHAVLEFLRIRRGVCSKLIELLPTILSTKYMTCAHSAVSGFLLLDSTS